MPRFNEAKFLEILTVRNLSRFNLTPEKQALLESAIKKIKIVQLHDLYGRFVEGIIAGVIDNEESVDKKKNFLELATLTDKTVNNINNNETASQHEIFTLKCYKQNPQTKKFEAREQEDEQLLKAVSQISQDKDDYQTIHKIRHQYLLNKLYHVRNNDFAFTETMSNMLLGRTEPSSNGTPKVVSKYFVSGSPSLTKEEWEVMQAVYPRALMNDKTFRREAHQDLELTLKEMQSLILSAVKATIEKGSAPIEQELLPAEFTEIQLANYENYTQESLFKLVESKKDEELIEKLKANKSLVNAIDHQTGKSLLLHAVKCQNKPIVEYLLKNGADANKVDHTGYSALHYGVEGGSTKIVRKIIKYQTNHNVEDWGGYTPLYIAAEKGKTKFVKLILSEIEDPNLANNKRGCSPLFMAVMNKHIETAGALLNHSAINVDLYSKGWHGEKHSPRSLALKMGGEMRDLFNKKAKPFSAIDFTSTPPAALAPMQQRSPMSPTPMVRQLTPQNRQGVAFHGTPINVNPRLLNTPSNFSLAQMAALNSAVVRPASNINQPQPPVPPKQTKLVNKLRFEELLKTTNPLTQQERKFIEDFCTNYKNPYRQLNRYEGNESSPSNVAEKFKREAELSSLVNKKISDLAKQIADWPKQTFAASYYEAKKILDRLEKEPNSLTFFALAFELGKYNKEHKYSYVGILDKLKQNISPMQLAIDETCLETIKLILLENPNRQDAKIEYQENLSSNKKIIDSEVDYAIKHGKVEAVSAILGMANQKPGEINLGNIPANAMEQAENVRKSLQNKNSAHLETEKYFGIDIEEACEENFKKLLHELGKPELNVSDERIHGLFTKEEYRVAQYGMGDIEKKVAPKLWPAEKEFSTPRLWHLGKAHFRFRKILTTLLARAEEIATEVDDPMDIDNNNNGSKKKPTKAEKLQYIRDVVEKACAENNDAISPKLSNEAKSPTENLNYIRKTIEKYLKNNLLSQTTNDFYRSLRRAHIPANRPVKINKFKHASRYIKQIKEAGVLVSPKEALNSGKVNFLATPEGTQYNIFFDHEGELTPLRATEGEIIEVERAKAIHQGLLQPEDVYTSPHIPAFAVERVERPIQFIGEDPNKKTVYRVFHTIHPNGQRQKLHWFDYFEKDVLIKSTYEVFFMADEFFLGINIKATNYRFIRFLRLIKGPFESGSYYHYVMNNPDDSNIQDSARGAIFNVLNSEAKVTKSLSVEHPAVKIIKNELVGKNTPLDANSQQKIKSLIADNKMDELKALIKDFNIYKEQLGFALYEAAKELKVDFVKYLLDCGVDPFANNNLVLQLAWEALIKEVRYVSDKAVWSERAHQAQTLLTVLLQYGATSSNDPQHIKYLPALDSIAKLNDQGWRKNTQNDLLMIKIGLILIHDIETQKFFIDNLCKLVLPLQGFTFNFGFEELHQQLLQRLNRPGLGYNSPEAKKWLNLVEQNNAEEIMAFLGQNEAERKSNNPYFYILAMAIRRNKPELVEKIYGYFEKTLCETEFPALHLAFYFKQEKVVEVLIKKRCHNNVNSLQIDTLFFLVKSGMTQFLEPVLKNDNSQIEHANYEKLFNYSISSNSKELADLAFAKLFVETKPTRNVLFVKLEDFLKKDKQLNQELAEKLLLLYQEQVATASDLEKVTILEEYTSLFCALAQKNKNVNHFTAIFEGYIKFIQQKFSSECIVKEDDFPDDKSGDVKQLKESVHKILHELINTNSLELFTIAVQKIKEFDKNLLFKFCNSEGYTFVEQAVCKAPSDFLKVLYQNVPFCMEDSSKKTKPKNTKSKTAKPSKSDIQINPINLIKLAIENSNNVVKALLTELKILPSDISSKEDLLQHLVRYAKPELLKWFFEQGYLLKDDLSIEGGSYLHVLVGYPPKTYFDLPNFPSEKVAQNLTMLTDEIGIDVNHVDKKHKTAAHLLGGPHHEMGKMVANHVFYHPRMDITKLDEDNNTTLHSMLVRIFDGNKTPQSVALQNIKNAIEHFATKGGSFSQKNSNGKNAYEIYVALVRDKPNYDAPEIRALFEAQGCTLEKSYFDRQKNHTMVYTAGVSSAEGGDLYLFVDVDGNYLFLEDRPTMFFGSDNLEIMPAKFSVRNVSNPNGIKSHNLQKPRPDGGWLQLPKEMFATIENVEVYKAKLFIRGDWADVELKIGPAFKLFVKYAMAKDGFKDLILKLKKYKNKEHAPCAMSKEDRQLLTTKLIESRQILEEILLSMTSPEKEKVDQAIDKFFTIENSLESMECNFTLYKNSTYYEFITKHPIEAAIIANNMYAIEQLWQKINLDRLSWSSLCKAIVFAGNQEVRDFFLEKIKDKPKQGWVLYKTYSASFQNDRLTIDVLKSMLKIMSQFAGQRESDFSKLKKELEIDIQESRLLQAEEKSALSEELSLIGSAKSKKGSKKKVENEEMEEQPLVRKRKKTSADESENKKTKSENNNNNNDEIREETKKPKKRKTPAKTFVDDDYIEEKGTTTKKPRAKKVSAPTPSVSEKMDPLSSSSNSNSLSPTFGSGVKTDVSTPSVGTAFFSLAKAAALSKATQPQQSTNQSVNNNNNNANTTNDADKDSKSPDVLQL